MQTPIAPPYAEALSLLENRRAGSSAFVFDHDTDFNEADISRAIENKSATWTASVKEYAFISAVETDSETNTIVKTAQDENKEEETAIDALQNLYISKEAGNIDNTE